MIQADMQMHLADLANLAASNTVINRSRDTLLQLGVSLNPEQLLRTLEIKPVTDTQILAIKVVSQDPEEAKTAADVVAMEFKRFYSELVSGAAEQSREFIEKQLKDAKAKLNTAQQTRTAFKKKNSLVELSQQSSVIVQRISGIEANISDARADSDAAGARLQSLNLEVNGKPEMRMTSKSVGNNPLYQQLLANLVSAESDLGVMIGSGKGKNHPEVREITKRIEEIKDKIAKQTPMMINQETTALDQVVVSALSSKISTEAEKAGADARYAALLSTLEEEKAKLSTLPEQEMRMAQLDMDVMAAEETYKLLRSKLDEARIKASETSKTSTIQLITPAYVYPVDPKTTIKLALAFLLSPILGVGIAFLLNYMDNTVKTPAEAEELLGLPVASIVPIRRSHALARRPENEMLLACYEMLTTQLWQLAAKINHPVILVASAEPDSGRTITAANLAVTLAKDGARVILVDADMRKPSQHLMFGVSNKPGLSNVLTGTAAIEDALIPTRIDGLLLMPAGPAPDNPIRLLRTQQMSDFVRDIGSLADFVVFDSPAGITFADATMMAALIKNVILVYSAGRVPRGAESEFRNRLDSVGADIHGVVLNRVRPEDSHGYFYYKRFYQSITAQSIGPVASTNSTTNSLSESNTDSRDNDA